MESEVYRIISTILMFMNLLPIVEDSRKNIIYIK